MISVIDYGLGNLHSIRQALIELGQDFTVSADSAVIADSDTVILPGVGAFGGAIAELRKSGMDHAVLQAAFEGKKILGICLGMQLLASRSEEFGTHTGLNLIKGDVRRLPEPLEESGTRIPNMGWRTVEPRNGFDLLAPAGGTSYFYFAHSYALRCEEEMDVLGTIAINGADVAAIVRHGQVWGVQFHPEKSGVRGLRLLNGILQSEA